MVSLLQKLVQDGFFRATSREKIFPALCPQYIQHQIHRPFHDTPWPRPFQDDDFRLKMGGLVVVASNAGGAWTPIGDITTTMLYIGGQVPLEMWCWRVRNSKRCLVLYYYIPTVDDFFSMSICAYSDPRRSKKKSRESINRSLRLYNWRLRLYTDTMMVFAACQGVVAPTVSRIMCLFFCSNLCSYTGMLVAHFCQQHSLDQDQASCSSVPIFFKRESMGEPKATSDMFRHRF